MPVAALSMIAVMLATLAGDYFIKRASLGLGMSDRDFWVGIGFYALSAIGLLIAMRHMSLASVGVWYAVLTLLAMTALGALVFGERLQAREMLGIGFAIASLVCMSRFA